jgi:hypothetical protein
MQAKLAPHTLCTPPALTACMFSTSVVYSYRSSRLRVLLASKARLWYSPRLQCTQLLLKFTLTAAAAAAAPPTAGSTSDSAAQHCCSCCSQGVDVHCCCRTGLLKALTLCNNQITLNNVTLLPAGKVLRTNSTLQTHLHLHSKGLGKRRRNSSAYSIRHQASATALCTCILRLCITARSTTERF